jgi:hypothetical protein
LAREKLVQAAPLHLHRTATAISGQHSASVFSSWPARCGSPLYVSAQNV